MILLDIGGLPVAVEGLSPEHEDRLRSEWRPWVLAAGDPWLKVRARIDPPREDCRPFSAKRMVGTFRGSDAHYVMEEGQASSPSAGEAAIHIASCGDSKQFYSLLTLLGAVFAWRAPSAGRLVLHAAGIVLDGRAFVLCGAEGAGKTTWARVAAEAGVPVLGDDLVVVRAEDDGAEAAGSPLRSRPWNSAGRGAWPLAGILLAEHGTPPRLRTAPPLVARAAVVAALPFVAEAMNACPGLDRTLESLFRSTPARVLRFAPDGAHLGLLRDATP